MLHGRRRTTYDAWVDYTYEINGRHYTSETFDFDDGQTINDVGGRNALYGLPTSGDATCFVDPTNPRESVIYRGTPESVHRSIPVGIGGVTLGMIVFGIGWRAKRRMPPVVAEHPKEMPAHWDLRSRG